MPATVSYSIHHDLAAYPWRPADNSGGLVGADGCLAQSLLHRRGEPAILPPQPGLRPAARKRIRHQVIYGGFLAYHFGHFLLESLARLSVCRLFPDVPIVWLKGKHGLKPWQTLLLGYLGVHNPHLFVTRQPALLSEVIVPSPGYMIDHFFSPEHAEFLGVFQTWPVPSPEKLWLSRSKVKMRSMTTGYGNEQALEAELEKRGWVIYHPQEHSLDRQIQALASAARIAGIEGSAFHWLMFFADYRTRVDIIARRGKIHPSFMTIAERKRLDQRVHYVRSKPGTDANGGPCRELDSIPAVVALLEEG